MQNKNFRIPKSYELSGLKIDIKFQTDLYTTHRTVGEEWFAKNLIILSPPSDQIHKEQISIAFLHEFYHSVFGNFGYDKENCNERLIELLAQSTYQMLMSSEYSEEIDKIIETGEVPEEFEVDKSFAEKLKEYKK